METRYQLGLYRDYKWWTLLVSYDSWPLRIVCPKYEARSEGLGNGSYCYNCKRCTNLKEAPPVCRLTNNLSEQLIRDATLHITIESDIVWSKLYKKLHSVMRALDDASSTEETMIAILEAWGEDALSI